MPDRALIGLLALSLFLAGSPAEAQVMKSFRERARNKMAYLLNPASAAQAKPTPKIPSIQTVPAADATDKTTPEASEKAIRESEKQAKLGSSTSTTSSAEDEKKLHPITRSEIGRAHV